MSQIPETEVQCVKQGCGHCASLEVRSVESPAIMCELCEMRSERNDALQMESEWKAKYDELWASRDALVNDLRADRDAASLERSELLAHYQRVQAQVEALQRENERLKAPVSDEEWNPRCWEDEEGDECLDRDGFDAIIRERSECSKIAQIYIPKWSLLRASLQELVDDLPEDRCADPNCGGGEYGECGVRARAEAALAATQPAPQEKKIWVMDWNTESGDDGIDGFWLKKPTAAQLKKFIAEHYPDDFEAQTFYYTLKELSLQSVTNQ
jgi:hypothetical protein